MWDMLGGGFPLDPIIAEMRAMGLSPTRPPCMEASRLEALRELWSGAGLTQIELREITVERTFGDFAEFWEAESKAPLHRARYRRDVRRRCRGATAARAGAPARRCARPHHLRLPRARGEGISGPIAQRTSEASSATDLRPIEYSSPLRSPDEGRRITRR
jgi:hypothetical protein